MRGPGGQNAAVVEASFALRGTWGKTLNGAVWEFDPVCRRWSAIVSANLARRNLTKGQQAIALAMIYPEPHSKKSKESLLFSKMRLSQARSVLRHSRDLAESVLKGSVSLDEALDKVARLRTAAPDLAACWMLRA